MPTTEELDAIIRPLPRSNYKADHTLKSLEYALSGMERDWGLELNPDYQRGHVWTEAQQVSFIENLIRGGVASTGKVVQFNHPNWEMDQSPNSDLPDRLQCIDGLQRLTALRRFMNGEIQAFGLHADDFDGTPYSLSRIYITFAIFRLQTRAELLQYYLDLNAGGTPHPESEIDRVRGLLDEARQSGRKPRI